MTGEPEGVDSSTGKSDVGTGVELGLARQITAQEPGKGGVLEARA